MSKLLPWDQIATPKDGYNVRLAETGMAVPVFWGKDVKGQWLTILELEGDHSAEFGRDPLIVHGISVDLRAGDLANTQRLVLTLQQQVDADLFLGMCETLVSTLMPVKDSNTAIAVALAHIRRWKSFLSGKRTGIMTPEEVRGLFAELVFLQDLYRSRLPVREAVSAWCGADKLQQDFIFRDTSVEVKSLSGKEKKAVRISSENQLEALSSRLFLSVFRLSDLPESPVAKSLNDMVRLIEGQLGDADAIESSYERSLRSDMRRYRITTTPFLWSALREHSL